MKTLEENSKLNKLLIQLELKNVSDVHIKSGHSVFYRFAGDIKMINNISFTSEEIVENIKPILTQNIQDQFKNNMQSDFSFATSNETRYRANLYRTNSGISLALRRINNEAKSLEELAPYSVNTFKEILNLDKGLVIVCGPTGSGKSTTLTAIINYINNNFEKHIITIEDPIEFIHKSNKCLIDQREVGRDVNSFADALKAALREDPDIILVGEIRDSESIKYCLNAAETGHLVFTTLHTQTASKSIDRIVDSCEPNEKEIVRSMLSSSIQAVILQKLLKKADNTGVVAAFEILLGISSVRNLIRENKISQIDSIIQMSSKYGMIDMETSIKKLYENHIITEEEMKANLNNIEDNGKENKMY